MHNQANSRGIIKTIVLVIIALIILGYFFNIKVQDIFSSSAVQANLSFAWSIVVKIWSYISFPFVWVWDTIVLGFIWPAILKGLGK